jgi:septation ring formation regulator EzrA
MNKKLLDIFVDPKILLKEAIEKDLKEIEKFLKKKIRIVYSDWRLDRKELKCVREIKNRLIFLSKNLDDDLRRIKAQTYKYYGFLVINTVEVDDLRELLRVFASNTIEAFINQKIMVECCDGESQEIIECPSS